MKVKLCEIHLSATKICTLPVFRKLLLIWVCSLLILFPFCKSYAFDIKFDNFPSEIGISSINVNCIIQDSYGFIWLGTNNGLIRHDGYTFKNLRSNIEQDTFLNSEIKCISEGPDHFLWIGTAGNGLICYDMQNERFDSIRLNTNYNQRINRIFFLDAHNVLVGTESGLLNIHLPEKFTSKTVLNAEIYYAEPPKQEIVHTNFITDLFQNREEQGKYLWIGTDGGLFKFDLLKKTFLSIPTSPQNSIRTFAALDKEHILVGSFDGGIFLINIITNRKEQNGWTLKINDYLNDKKVETLVFDDKNRLWVGTLGDGLHIFETSNSGQISTAEYKKGNKEPFQFTSNFVYRIFKDRQGIMWIATMQGGLGKAVIQKSGIEPIKLPNIDNADFVNNIQSVDIARDSIHLWVGTYGSGLYYIDPDRGALQKYSSKSGSGIRLINDMVTFSKEDQQGNLWIVLQFKGLFLVPSAILKKIKSGALTGYVPIDANSVIADNGTINPFVMMLYFDNAGEAWIGTWTSLHRVKFIGNLQDITTSTGLKSKCQVTTLFSERSSLLKGFTNSPVMQIIKDNKQNIWVGTRNNGVLRITENVSNNFRYEIFNTSKGLKSNQIIDICEDNDKNIWVGTSSGLSRYDVKSNKFKTYTETDGLPNEIINGIVSTEKGIWISSSYGMSFLEAGTRTFKNHFIANNDIFNRFNPNSRVIVQNKKVYFSSTEALISFDPNAIFSEPTEPSIFITSVKVNNQTVTVGKRINGNIILKSSVIDNGIITLPYNHILSLEYASLDYSFPQRNQYKYKFEGASDEWIVLNASQRNIMLSNVPRGTYKLYLKASNSEGVWNKESLVVKIKVLPPFWLTNWSIAFYIIVFIFSFWLYRKIMLQRAEQKRIIEQERFERKKIEELNLIKTEFFTNISHECRTPLTLIINPLEKIIDSNPTDKKLVDQIRIIYSNSKRLLRLIDELMDFSKLENKGLSLKIKQGNIVEFSQKVSEYFRNLALQKNIVFRFESIFPEILVWFDFDKMEKIIFNLLSNAFKYTHEKGLVMLQISANDDFVNIAVTDNGTGIDKAELDKIFERFYQAKNVSSNVQPGTGIGLAMVKSYVELHHGKVIATSSPATGTCFEISIPLGHKHFAKDEVEMLTTTENISEEIPEQVIENLKIKPSSTYSVLIVEDNYEIRKYIRNELAECFEVHEADNGKEGILKAKEIVPDLIISDVIMPEIDGMELCKILKSDIATSHIPIILLTAKAAIENQIEGIELGAEVYITKPFSVKFLEAQIFRLIEFKESIYKRFLKENMLIPENAGRNSIDETFINKVLVFIEQNLSEPELNVEQLASSVNLSRIQVYRKIKALTGQPPVEFIRTVRLKKAANLILERKLTYAEIAYETGFATPSYFTRCFREHFGKTPSEYANDYGSN